MLNKKLSAYCAYDELEVKQDPYREEKAWLIRRLRENPTYFAPIGYVECPALNKRWELNSATYFSYPYLGTTHFSQLLFGGDEFQIVYRLSQMSEMAEGTYQPYFDNDFVADSLWDSSYHAFSFLVGTYSDYNNSTFWHKPETHYYRMLGGQLKYQKQDNVNKCTFNFTGDDGYSYHGEFAGEIHQ